MKQLYTSMRRNILLTLSLLTWIEGLILNILYWMEPSSAKNAWLGGFSRDRLLLGGAAFLVMFFLSITILIWVTKPNILLESQNKFNTFLNTIHQRQSLWLISALLAGICCLVLIQGWSQNIFSLPPLFFALFEKTYPFIFWCGLFSLQILIFTLYAVIKTSSANFSYKELYQVALMLICSGVMVLQWTILALRIRPPYLFNQFVWEYAHTDYSLAHYLIVAFWITAGIILFILYHKSVSIKKLALLAVFWFYLAQLFIPQIQINSSPDALTRYQQSPISHVVYNTCAENPGYAKILSSYDSYFKQDFWLGTKPAGYLIFYSLLKDIPSPFNTLDCQSTLGYIIFFLFPLLSTLSIVFILKITKEIYGWYNFLAGLFFFILPNMLFFSLIADQALYPFLFSLTMWLTIMVSRQNKRIIPAILLGALLYLDIFLSFSLLPALGFVAIWFLLNLFTNNKDRQLSLLKQGIVSGLIFVLLCLLVWACTGYAPWERYLSAFSNHRAIKQIQLFSGDSLSIIFLNHFEFFYWSGLVILPLLLKSMINSIKQLLNRHITLPVIFNTAILLVWIILNLAGQTRGEVGRLWLFITPALMILVADAVKEWPQRFQIGLLAGQMISAALFFQVYYIP